MRTGSRGEPISPFARLERAKLPTERTAASQPSSLALPSVLWQEPQRRAVPALPRESGLRRAPRTQAAPWAATSCDPHPRLPARTTPATRPVLGNILKHLASAAQTHAVPSGNAFYTTLTSTNLTPQLRAGIVPKPMAILVPVPEPPVGRHYVAAPRHLAAMACQHLPDSAS